MQEEIEYHGLWWLPEKPDNQVSGHLKYTPNNKIILDLLGTLQDSPYTNNSFEPLLILGVTSTGKYITLQDCFLTNTTLNGGFVTSSLSVQRIFIEVHFETVEEIKFKSISVHYAHLDEWVDKTGFNVDHSKLHKGRLAVKYQQPKPIKVTVGDYEIMIQNVGPSTSFDRLNEMRISQKAWITISSVQEKSLDDYLAISRHIQNFLSLAMSSPTHPLTMQGETEANKEILENGKAFYYPVKIFYKPLYFPTNKKALHQLEMLFTLPDVEEKFAVYIANWINKANLLGPVYDLYFSTLYNPYMYLESKFLNLIQAIETYHRRKFGGKYQSDEEYQAGLYKKFVNVIPSDLEKGFKQSLKEGKLKYANEFSLRKRLQEIVDRLSPKFAIEFIGLPKARKEFISKVNDTRNYLTHYSQDLSEKSAEGSELLRLTEKLEVLLEICLLEEIGTIFAL